jgi:NTP pyrophosphatase (non-canonical NTP hydrolase)
MSGEWQFTDYYDISREETMPVQDANTGTIYGEIMDAKSLIELSLNEYQRRLHTYKSGNYSCHALGLMGELAESLDAVYSTLQNASKSRELTVEDARRALDVVIAAGKVADRVKKQEHHGCDKADASEIMKELGDVLWYITAVAGDYGLTLQQVAEANIAKLRARYPNGFEKGGGIRDDASATIDNAKERLEARIGSINRSTGPIPSNPQAGIGGVESSAFSPVPIEPPLTGPSLSYGDALHIIESYYKAGIRDIVVPERVYKAYESGLTPCTLTVEPRLAYKTAKVRSIR